MPRSSLSKIKKKATDEDTLLVAVVQRYFQLAGIVSVVWLIGYFKFSVSWLWLLLVMYVWKEKHKKARMKKIIISQDLARDEKEVILARVDDLPSWVNFPDVERAEWVNKILCQMWPFIGEIVESILRDSVEDSIRQSLPTGLQSFKFSKIDLGNIPPRIGGIKVYTRLKRDEIYMDLELNYSSDSNFEVSVKGMSAGIKNMRIHGTLRVVFRPLINKIPLIGGMLVFFLNNPEIDFDFTSLANALDLPGLSDMLHSSIMEQIANFMVLPNRFPIQLVDGLDLNRLRYPQPQGVVRIKVIEAKDLIRADIGFTGLGKSDPYCKIRIGAKTVKTKVIQNSLAPVWDETFDLIVDSADGQLLYIDVYDEDPGIMHDLLGHINLDLTQLIDSGFEDEWLPLEDVKHGMIHVQLTWLWLANQANELDRVAERLVAGEKLHVAILLVYLDSASNLPAVAGGPKKCGVAKCRGKKSLNEPSPQVMLSVGQQTETSLVMYNSTDPKWEQNFRFLLHNPHYQNLDVEIVDVKIKKPIGRTVIKIKQVLLADDMTMDQKFQVKTPDADSAVQMRLCLRILTPDFHPDYIDDVENLIEETGLQGSSVDSRPPSAPLSKAHSETSAVTKTNGITSPANVSEEVAAAPPPSEDNHTSSTMTDEQMSELRQRKVLSSSTAGRYGLGRIQMTFRYSCDRGKLIIVIHRCINLKSVTGDSKSMGDPYVKLNLLPDKSNSSKRRTKVLKNNLNPVFDETIEFSVSQSDLPNRQLWLCVKNESKIFSSSKPDVGHALLDVGSMDITKAVTEWFDLCPGSALKLTPFTYDA